VVLRALNAFLRNDAVRATEAYEVAADFSARSVSVHPPARVRASPRVKMA
jgi:hypothetical protein